MDLVSYLPKSTKVYYAHPYSFYESGTNEKQNFLVRRFFPKRTSFDNISDEQVAYVEHWINNFPREIFNYHCSDFIFRMSYLILQFREKYPQKINSFLWMWLVCPLFYPQTDSTRQIRWQKSTEDPIPGILRFSQAVSLQPLYFTKLFTEENGTIPQYPPLKSLADSPDGMHPHKQKQPMQEYPLRVQYRQE